MFDDLKKTEQEPRNIDAEQGVLGAILFDNDCFDNVSRSLKPEHFYDPYHGQIYYVCGEMISSGKIASPVTLKNHFKQDPAFDSDAYIKNLALHVVTTLAAKDYADEIVEMATRRGLGSIARDMHEAAFTPQIEQSPQGLIEAAEVALYNLSEKGHHGNGFISFDHSIQAAMESINAAFQHGGGLVGHSTGLNSLDRKLGGLHDSDLIILAGRPSMGKTALGTNIAVNVAKQVKQDQAMARTDAEKEAARGVVAFFSLEMAHEQLTSRVLAEVSGIGSDRLRRGAISQVEFDSLYTSKELIKGLPLYTDETGGISLAQLVARIRRLKRQRGLKFIVIDYLQLMTAGKRMDNRVAEITYITMGLKALAKELNVPILALSQLSRAVETRSDKRPQLSDLRDSGSIEQDADVVMFVYREEYYLTREEPEISKPEHAEWQIALGEAEGKAEIIIGKQRHGPIGTVKLGFDGAITKFSDLEGENTSQGQGVF